MQGHIAPGDYHGRFQGSTSMRVDDAAFGYGCWPLLEWLSIEQWSHSAHSRGPAFSSLIVYAWDNELAWCHENEPSLPWCALSGFDFGSRQDASGATPTMVGGYFKDHLFDRPKFASLFGSIFFWKKFKNARNELVNRIVESNKPTFTRFFVNRQRRLHPNKCTQR